MSISDKLKKLKEIKDNIFNALVKKGVEVDASAPFSSYANYINNISTEGKPEVYIRKDTNLDRPITQSVTNFTDFEANDKRCIKIQRYVKNYITKLELNAAFEWIEKPNYPNGVLCNFAVFKLRNGTSFKIYINRNYGEPFYIYTKAPSGDGTYWTTPVELNKKYHIRLTCDYIYSTVLTEIFDENEVLLTSFDIDKGETFTYESINELNYLCAFSINSDAAIKTMDATGAEVSKYFKFYLEETNCKINDEIYWDINTPLQDEVPLSFYLNEAKSYTELPLGDLNYIPSTLSSHIENIYASNAIVAQSNACTSNTNLKSVEASLVKAEYQCFKGCTNLENIDLTKLIHAGYSVFDGCTNLKGRLNPKIKSVDAYSFAGCANLEITDLSELEYIKNTRAFSGCKGLIGDIELNNIKSVGSYTFYNTSLTSFSSTSDLFTTTNASNFLANCTNLETVNLPNATSLSDGFCSSCSNLKNIYIPKVTSLGSNCFSGCSSLETINLPQVTSVGSDCFANCTSLETVNLPTVTSVHQRTFSGCSSLKTLNLPLVTKCYYRAFAECTSLETVDLPEATTIGVSSGSAGYTFSGCTNLISVNIPKVTTLTTYEFSNCSSLKTVNMPSVTKLSGAYTFNNCTSLESMDLSNITSLAGNTFYGCTQNLKVWIPSTCTTISANQANNASVTFYTDVASASSKPSGWNSKWNGSGTVVYGATYEDFLAA